MKSAKMIMKNSNFLQFMTFYCFNIDVVDEIINNEYAFDSND